MQFFLHSGKLLFLHFNHVFNKLSMSKLFLFFTKRNVIINQGRQIRIIIIFFILFIIISFECLRAIFIFRVFSFFLDKIMNIEFLSFSFILLLFCLLFHMVGFFSLNFFLLLLFLFGDLLLILILFRYYCLLWLNFIRNLLASVFFHLLLLSFVFFNFLSFLAIFSTFSADYRTVQCVFLRIQCFRFFIILNWFLIGILITKIISSIKAAFLEAFLESTLCQSFCSLHFHLLRKMLIKQFSIFVNLIFNFLLTNSCKSGSLFDILQIESTINVFICRYDLWDFNYQINFFTALELFELVFHMLFKLVILFQVLKLETIFESLHFTFHLRHQMFNIFCLPPFNHQLKLLNLNFI